VRGINDVVLLLQECVVRFLVEYVGQVGRGSSPVDRHPSLYCLGGMPATEYCGPWFVWKMCKQERMKGVSVLQVN